MKWSKSETHRPPDNCLCVFKVHVQDIASKIWHWEYYIAYIEEGYDEMLDQFGDASLPWSFYQDYEYWSAIIDADALKGLT